MAAQMHRGVVYLLLGCVLARTAALTASVGPRPPSRDGSATSPRKVVVIGAGWGGLSVAHALSKESDVAVTVVDASPRPGGLVSDGFLTPGGRRAEAGQHGFWDEYHNIFRLIDELELPEDPLTGYAEQGQYSPRGLEAVWPVYRDANRAQLPTGLGQALYTRFINLPPADLATAAPLVLAFSEFDDSEEAWERYDKISFHDLCVKLGVSRRLYKEAFEPMILTGLFAPGEQCSAAAALGMAYFFVLKHQTSFDVRWCKGNIGELILRPWVEQMQARGVTFLPSTKAVGFELDSQQPSRLAAIRCATEKGAQLTLAADEVVFAVGMSALNALVRGSPTLASAAEFRRFADLRGLSVLAMRLFLDRDIETEHTANACWGFDEAVGMTWFDIKRLHHPRLDHEPGAVIEIDFYHAASLLVQDDESLVVKAKSYLDQMVPEAASATVTDAAVVRLPNAVNWYFPGSFRLMPNVRSSTFKNAYFVGDLVRSRHGSWSQEKAYVTGIEAANAILGRPLNDGVIPLKPDETHVAAGRTASKFARSVLGAPLRLLGANRDPSLADFL
mmetsp:Transcript_1928/g.4554  ORF Transcript_1928/g.4554 Transcript_1928/m.4554 type:complete len:560 (-) Transcript_1928:249-1928(-)